MEVEELLKRWQGTILLIVLYVVTGLLLTLSQAPWSVVALALFGAFSWAEELALAWAWGWALALVFAWEEALSFIWLWAWGWFWAWPVASQEWSAVSIPRQWIALWLTVIAALGLGLGLGLGRLLSPELDVTIPANWGYLPPEIR